LVECVSMISNVTTIINSLLIPIYFYFLSFRICLITIFQLFPYTTLFRSCSECLKKFVKKKGKICSGCNKEINTEGLCNDCLQWKQKYVGNLLDNRSLYQYNDTFHDVDRKSTRLNSSHVSISYAVFCLKKKKKIYLYI